MGQDSALHSCTLYHFWSGGQGKQAREASAARAGGERGPWAEGRRALGNGDGGARGPGGPLTCVGAQRAVLTRAACSV